MEGTGGDFSTHVLCSHADLAGRRSRSIRGTAQPATAGIDLRPRLLAQRKPRRRWCSSAVSFGTDSRKPRDSWAVCRRSQTVENRLQGDAQKTGCVLKLLYWQSAQVEDLTF